MVASPLIWRQNLIILLSFVLVFFVAACVPVTAATPAPAPTPVEETEGVDEMEGMQETEETDGMEEMEGMEEGQETEGTQGMDMSGGATIPAGMAYLDGEEITFVHTEVSDPDIAQVLTDMMSSPVIVVPSLADAPDSMLADVYVFTNGIVGMGPLGFQPDVFDNPPGTEGYSPLRRLITVTWQDETAARELKSVAEVAAAEAAGEVTLEQPGVVINMPFVTWLGGSR